MPERPLERPEDHSEQSSGSVSRRGVDGSLEERGVDGSLEGDSRARTRARAGHPSARHLTLRRLVGLDRSGPPPPQTLAGEPLRPWTIPNAIGFIRLLLIPVFLVVALSSEDGVDALAAILFAVIGWGDYAGRDRGARHTPIQPPRRADGPRHRPSFGRKWGRGVLALRPVAPLGLGGACRARVGDGYARPLRPEARRGATHQLARAHLGGAIDGGPVLCDDRARRAGRSALVCRLGACLVG